MVSTLVRNARDLSLIPALGTIFTIFIKPLSQHAILKIACHIESVITQSSLIMGWWRRSVLLILSLLLNNYGRTNKHHNSRRDGGSIVCFYSVNVCTSRGGRMRKSACLPFWEIGESEGHGFESSPRIFQSW